MFEISKSHIFVHMYRYHMISDITDITDITRKCQKGCAHLLFTAKNFLIFNKCFLLQIMQYLYVNKNKTLKYSMCKGNYHSSVFVIIVEFCISDSLNGSTANSHSLKNIQSHMKYSEKLGLTMLLY